MVSALISCAPLTSYALFLGVSPGSILSAVASVFLFVLIGPVNIAIFLIVIVLLYPRRGFVYLDCF
jgi:hypothetical protein